MDYSYLFHFFPKGLLDYFTITQFYDLYNGKENTAFYEIHLEENNTILGDFDQRLYESKGFTKITLQDFPIRGKAVYLVVKRRRWRLKTDKTQIIRNRFSFVSEGSGFTQELSDFLKGSGRYKGRYHFQHQ